MHPLRPSCFAAALALSALVAMSSLPVAAESTPTFQATRQAELPPFTSPDEAVEFLRTAKVIRVEPVGSGTTRPNKVLLEKDGLRLSAIFHQIDRQQRDVRVGNQFFRVFYDSYMAQCAAYDLARVLGLDNVPPTVLRRIKGRDGSLQLWVEGAMTEKRRGAQGLRPPNTRRWIFQLQVMRLFDNLIYNDDRNSGNMVIDSGWKLWMIDHSRSFQRLTKLRDPGRVTMVERSLWQRLRNLDDDQIAEAVRPYLESIQVQALLARRRQLVEHIEALIAERGEEAVLFDASALGPTRAAAQDPAPADLVLRHGKVATVNEAFAMAEAVAIRGHQIIAVGTDAQIASYVGPETEIIELAGRLAIPGFIEGHGHFLGLGRARMILDLTGAQNWDQIVAMVERAAREAQPGDWIYGRGWHQEKWDSMPRPNVAGVTLHDGLSEVSPENPVLLTHASGHAAFVNELAMRLAGIEAGTPDPDGGTIVRDQSGDPTGLLRETAQRLVRAVASGDAEELTDVERDALFRRQVELAGREALSKGVTSFQDAGSSFGTIDEFRALAAEGALPVRLYVMVRSGNDALEASLGDYRIIPQGNDFLAVRSVKRAIDGALGSHGAWLLEPYEDLDSVGLNTMPLEELERTAAIAIDSGFQLNVHAIGDRANREVLDLFERTFAAHPERAELRWRIEHSQHLHPDDIPRFGALGVIASMQAIHCTSDAPWVLKRLGPGRAAAGAYMWRDLLDWGAVVTNGTDVPVEDIDPIASYYATVSRRTRTGDLFYPDQRMTRQEALRSYTISNAYAAFEEHLKGSIEPGKLADITVLSQDILTVPEEQIPATRVEMTIVGGEIRYRR